MGILPDLGYATSVGGGFPDSDPLQLLPDKEQISAVCLEIRSVGEQILYRIGLACLSKMARVSGSPKSSEPADENDDVKLTNVREKQLVFYTTQI
jgi:hypothetical protein